MTNIINKIERNTFLRTVFPDGLDKKLLIGNLALRLDGNLLMDIHTLQKPHTEIKKWGIWGESYNVIVVKILCLSIDEIHILNWQFNKFSIVDFSYDSDRIIITTKIDGCDIKISCKYLTFQECTTYML